MGKGFDINNSMIDFVDSEPENETPKKADTPQEKDSSLESFADHARHLSVSEINEFADGLVSNLMKVNNAAVDEDTQSALSLVKKYLQNRIHTLISVRENNDVENTENVAGVKASRILLIACDDKDHLSQQAESGLMIFTLDGEKIYVKKPTREISRTVAQLYAHQNLRVLQSSSIMQTFERLYGQG